MPVITTNKRAFFDYEILEKFEAGLVLSGQEVKSIKTGHIDLKGSYVTIQKNEAWLINAHIPLYKMAGKLPSYEPTRSRKLLLHRKEIKNLLGKLTQKGLTLIPIKVYTKHNQIKLEFGIGKGKKKFDKRETIRKREIERTIRKIKY